MTRTRKQLTQKNTKLIPTVRSPTPKMVELPLAKVLALVFNMMDPHADKNVGPEMLAEYVKEFSRADVEHFVMHEVTKLPGYNIRDGLKILDALTKWQETYFA